MPTTDTNVPQVIVNKLTKAQYETATKSSTEFYAVSDEQIGTSDIADGAVTAAKASFTTYSTSEQVVGTWIDGKPLYRKTINLGSLTSDTQQSIDHNIANVDMIWATNLFAWKTDSYSRSFNYFTSSSQFVQVSRTQVVYNIPSAADPGSSTLYATLEYTKTTD